MSDTTTKLAYSVEETARMLSVGRSTLYELINIGELPSFTIGSRRLIARTDVENYINIRRGSVAEAIAR